MFNQRYLSLYKFSIAIFTNSIYYSTFHATSPVIILLSNSGSKHIDCFKSLIMRCSGKNIFILIVVDNNDEIEF